MIGFYLSLLGKICDVLDADYGNIIKHVKV